MKRLSFILIVSILSSLMVAGKAWSQATGRSAIDILSGLGFQVLNTVPIDFELPNLQGERRKLSDWKGQWVWLNFWATWCGPCRQEMPTLEVLHRQLGDKGLKIVGLSVDQGPTSSVASYIKRAEISFEILHDPSGKVSSQYQASAIPSIYVISPDGKLVGLFRGGKSWSDSRTIAQVASLISFKQVDLAAPTASAQTDKLSLPDALIPPDVEVGPVRGEVTSGEIFVLPVEVLWKGPAAEYVIRPPKITLPEGMSIISTSLESSSEAGRDRMSYLHHIRTSKKGEYRLGPVEVSYQPRRGGEEQFIRHGGIDLFVLQKWSWVFWIVIAVVIVLTVFILTALKRQRSSTEGHEDRLSSDYSHLREQFLKGQKLKMEGGSREAALLFLDLQQIVEPERKDELKALMEEIRFAGFMPTEKELEHYQKNLERILSKEEE